MKIRLPIHKILTNDLLLPAVLLVVYLGFLVVARGVLPTTDEMIIDFQNLYARFGYEILFLSALLESLVVINFFVPGQIAMALGVIFARSGHTHLSLVITAVCLGAILGYSVDFFLGYFGFSDILKKLGYGAFLTEANSKLKRFGKRGLILSFVHSNIAAFVSLAAGSVKYKPHSFLIIAITSTFVWATLWGLMIYSLGDIFLVIIKRYTFLIVLAFISLLFLMRLWQKKDN